jgi:nucleoside-diphosphate-sugar epimerase
MMNSESTASIHKVAIIGAGGFVGSRMVEIFHLLKVVEIVPVVRRVSAMARLSRFQLNIAIADSRRLSELTNALKGCSAVVDCTVGMPLDIESAARVLIPAAKAAGVSRVVYLSSASVHGQNPRPGSDETTLLSDRQELAYNNAKVRAERNLFADAQHFGIELFVLRPCIVFGPRDRWITTLVDELKNGTAWLVENGQGICNTIYVDNLIEAIRCCLTAPAEASGKPYLVGDAEYVSWHYLYESTANKLGIDMGTVHQLPVPPDPVRNIFDVLEDIRIRPSTQRLIALVPRRIKAVIKGAVASMQPQIIHNPWKLPIFQQRLCPAREMVLLQRCRHKFPMLRAAQELGYCSIVPFEEGLQRTIKWIEWTTL